MGENNLNDEPMDPRLEFNFEEAVPAAPGTIRAKLEDKMLKIRRKDPDGLELAAKVQTLAVAAIIGGANSQAWADYVSLIVDEDPDQIAKLTPVSVAQDDSPQVAEAKRKWNLAMTYMLGNGPCGDTSTGGYPIGIAGNQPIFLGGFINGIDDELDKSKP